MLCGEVPSSTGYLKPVQWEPNLYIEVTENEVGTKIKAMKTYKGKTRPPSTLKKSSKSISKSEGIGRKILLCRIFYDSKDICIEQRRYNNALHRDKASNYKHSGIIEKN